MQSEILTALVYLGNSSTVRKRVTLILHDNDFADLSACTFWLPPQLPLSPYLMRTFATQFWANATLSLYPSTVGPEEWIRFTDAVLQRTPATTPLGTECLEPGANVAILEARGIDFAWRALAGTRQVMTARAREEPPSVEPIIVAYATAQGPRILWQRILDLGPMSSATLSFESWLDGSESRGLVQVSRDGADWITLAVLSPSAGWSTVGLDLAAYAGAIAHVRLVLDATDSPPGAMPDRWQVREIRVHRTGVQ
jgi:hypothetical protein